MMSSARLSWTLSYDPSQNSAACDHSQSDAEPNGAFSNYHADTGIYIAGIWLGDNATQLRGQLGLNGTALSIDILANGWAAWRTELAEKLRGQFSLAIFDPQAHQLYLARDALGVEPLFLARGAAGIAASSCPRSARRSAKLPSNPDAAMVADFVRGEISSVQSSFHEGLTRVPPGQTLLISPTLEKAERYFSFDTIDTENPENDAVDTFRQLFTREIKSRGAYDDRIALLLSGGLDSSAVAGVLANLRATTNDVTTLSLTYEGDADWVDRPYIAAMREALAMDHHSLPSENRDPFDNMDELLTALDGPSFGYGISVSTSLFTYARDLGLRTVMHGHGGDEIVSYGVGRLNELAKSGDWRTLWRETEGASALSGQSRWHVFKRYLVHRPKWRWLKSKLSHKKHQGDEGTPIAAFDLPSPAPSLDNDPRPIQARPEHTERDIHIAALTNPVQPHALETIMLTGRYHGLKIAMPFMSRELAEFSVSLPAHWKLQGGFTRYVLREAIRPFVPAVVANRRDKNDFSQGFINGLITSPFAREFADPGNPDLTQYFNRQWLIESWAEVERDGRNLSTHTARGLWRAAVLGRWLAMDRDAGILGSSPGVNLSI